ncbi:MAG TPA: hypothetical protein VIK29_11995 [Paludibacter sp.]
MKAKDNQSLFDIALQSSGSVEAAFNLALLNSIGITDDIVTGVELTPTDILNKQVAAYYLAKQIIPATLEAQIITGSGSPVDIASLSQAQNNFLKALSGQTLFDIALQSAGSVDATFDLALMNSIGITDDIVPGVELTPTDILNKQVAAYYLVKQITPATLEAQIITGSGSPVDITSLSQAQNNSLKALSGQTLFDIALQSAGSVEAAFDLALMNSIGITDDVVPGLNLTVASVVNKQIADYYKNKGIKPATYSQTESGIGGIEYWAIETEFIVS